MTQKQQSNDAKQKKPNYIVPVRAGIEKRGNVRHHIHVGRRAKLIQSATATSPESGFAAS